MRRQQQQFIGIPIYMVLPKYRNETNYDSN